MASLSSPIDAIHESLSLTAFCRFLWRYFRQHKPELAIIGSGCAIETSFYWAVPLCFRHLIDVTLPARDGTGLAIVLTVLIGGGAMALAGSYFRGRSWSRLQSQVLSDLRFELFYKLQRLGPAFFSKTSVGSTLARFSTDVTEIEAATINAVSWGALPGFDCLVGTLVLFTLDWRLALVAILVWPWVMFTPPWVAPRAAVAGYARKNEEAALLETVQQEVTGYGVIRAYNLERVTLREFLVRNGKLFAAGVRLNFLTALIEQASMAGMLMLQVITLGIGAWFAFQGSLTIGTLAAFQALYLSISNSLMYFTQYIRGLLPARAALRRCQELLNEPEILGDGANATLLRPFEHAIEFRDVSFRYEGHEVLRNISLTIHHGEFIGIVGASGSGKSTLLGLLLRFYDPTGGQITVDGVDLRTIKQESWRSQLGVVFQENFLFNTTVCENIRMGRPYASMDQVIAAARLAEIHTAIERQPDAYETSMGERGARFSGGERQRIAVARALIREPAILVLDEATSALDPQTEAALQETLQGLARGRTVIAVTHRLRSVEAADRIVVMERGQVVEQGSHADLIASDGIYAAMWNTQNQTGAVTAAT